MRLLLAGLAVAAAGAVWLGLPERGGPVSLAGLPRDAGRGKRVFRARGCASCHAAPGAVGEDRLILSGGLRRTSAFGTVMVPNISPDPTHGIDGWRLAARLSAP